MSDPYHSPGPDADRAFTFGLAAIMTCTVVTLAAVYYARVLSAREALMFVLVGLPVVYILASCLLSVWLGYDKRFA